jgi:glycosyltransferase involved in cell wall biosynthesis
MATMINVGFVIDTIETPNAGTEKQLLLLVRNLDRSRFAPHLICMRSSKWLEEAVPCENIYNLGMTRFASFQFFRAISKFKKYCRKNDIKVVQTFFRDGNMFGTIAAYFSGIRTIISSRRNYGAGYWHNRFWVFTLKVLQYMTKLYVSNSEINADYAMKSEGIPASKMRVIYNGLILDEYDTLDENTRREIRTKLDIEDNHILVGITANMRPVKNLGFFVGAAAELYNRYQDVRFVIIGDGPLRADIEKQISDLKLIEIVKLGGRQNDVVPYLRGMDIGVLCSKSESLSNSIIEYMATGLPCVVSDVGGNREAIGGVAGVLFKDDDESDYIEKISPFIENKKLREDIGKAARKYAFDNYNHLSIVKKYEDLYIEYVK